MQPRVFVDLFIEPPQWADLPRAAGAAFKQLHGILSETPGRYALALPDYPNGTFRRLRLFAATESQLEHLAFRLRESPLRIDHIRAVPEDFSGNWYCYSRYRIPTRRQERHPDGTLRLRRIRAADEANLPYFPMKSASNGQLFRVYVQVLRAEPTPGDCQPDTYGLCVASRRFALPDIQ